MFLRKLILFFVLLAALLPLVSTSVRAAPTCSIGSVTLNKSSTSAPSGVTINIKNSQNVGYFHVSYMDPYSLKGHASASGYNINRSVFHYYSQPGYYKPVISAYSSSESFKNKQPCDSKTISFSLSKITIADKWQWPTEGKIISTVGMRHQPVTGEYRMHQGIDIKNFKGTRINAARNGKVVAINASCRKSASNCGGGYGNYVVLKHSNGLYSIYAHLSKVNVRVGNSVSATQKIGEMGSTGLTPDVHLHFGIGPTIWVNNNVKDPLKLLPKR